jgi:ATPase family AAA domain-containing protein 3A/B
MINAKAEGARMMEEERRKTLSAETEHAKARAQYQDQLARKRQEDETAMKAQLHADNLRKQEESIAKQEALRKCEFKIYN